MGCGGVWELGWVGGWKDGWKVEVCERAAVVGWVWGPKDCWLPTYQ